MMRKKLSTLNVILFVAVGVVGLNMGSLIELVLDRHVPEYLVPRPQNLFNAFTTQPWEWVKAMGYTTLLSTIAAAICCGLGVLLGVVTSFLKLWSIDRWAQLIWSIPMIAIAVYLSITVGIGWLYGISLAVFLGFYPIEKYTFDFCSTKAEGVTCLCAAFNLTRYEEFRHIRIPSVLRSLGTSLSQTLPLCFIGETMGEYTSAKISSFSVGLGGYLRYAQNYSNYKEIWLSIVCMMLLVFASGELVRKLWDRLFPNNKEIDVFQ
jgi:ABC-type nitrate/sulfonate/bicarbonate transport system permease component